MHRFALAGLVGVAIGWGLHAWLMDSPRSDEGGGSGQPKQATAAPPGPSARGPGALRAGEPRPKALKPFLRGPARADSAEREPEESGAPGGPTAAAWPEALPESYLPQEYARIWDDALRDQGLRDAPLLRDCAEFPCLVRLSPEADTPEHQEAFQKAASAIRDELAGSLLLQGHGTTTIAVILPPDEDTPALRARIQERIRQGTRPSD